MLQTAKEWLRQKHRWIVLVCAALVVVYINEKVVLPVAVYLWHHPRVMEWRYPRVLTHGGDEAAHLCGGLVDLRGRGVVSSPIEVGETFSVEVLVKPFFSQVAYAGLVGNHPGVDGKEGFVLQRLGDSPNVYYFTFGNGRLFLGDAIRFMVPPNSWSYLAIVVKHSQVDVYGNGALVASGKLEGPMANSGLSLRVGNWEGDDRPFNGVIKEVRVVNGALSVEDIGANMEAVREMLNE